MQKVEGSSPFSRLSQKPCTSQVVVRAHDGRALVVEFSGVESLDEHRDVGMMLYALSEFEEAGELRRFDFVNRDDEEDARLELLARDFTCAERPS